MILFILILPWYRLFVLWSSARSNILNLIHFCIKWHLHLELFMRILKRVSIALVILINKVEISLYPLTRSIDSKCLLAFNILLFLFFVVRFYIFYLVQTCQTAFFLPIIAEKGVICGMILWFCSNVILYNILRTRFVKIQLSYLFLRTNLWVCTFIFFLWWAFFIRYMIFYFQWDLSVLSSFFIV